MRKLVFAALAAYCIASPAGIATAAEAAGTATGNLHIVEPWARAMLPGQPSGGAFMTLRNEGEEADTLLSVASPAAAKVEIHTMEVVDDVMVMRPVEGGLEIPASGTVTLAPGGLHLMFMRVEEPFAEGGEIPVTLTFEKAGDIEVALPVRSARAGRTE